MSAEAHRERKRCRNHESTGHVENGRGGGRRDSHSFASLWPIAGERRLARQGSSLSRITGAPGWRLRAGKIRSNRTSRRRLPSLVAIALLKQTPPNKTKLAEFIRTHHPRELKKLEQERRAFEFQQVQALVWLGEDASELKERILAWNQPLAYLKQYEQHGYPLFSSEMGVILSRAMLGVPSQGSAIRVRGLSRQPPARQRQFQQHARGGRQRRSCDEHVVGLAGAAPRSKWPPMHRPQTIAWLRACQLANGGFTFAPKPEFGGVDDVAYTWAAVRALKHLGATPANRDACVKYLHSLANADGGFSDRPGWLSNPMATYYALDALEALDELKPNLKFEISNLKPTTALPDNLKVFTIQIEAHGKGSPAEAVDLARALRIHLWGAKNAKPEWLARAQAMADAQKVPVKFFVSDEEYGTWVNVPGLGTYSHTSDIIAPADCKLRRVARQQGHRFVGRVSPAATRAARTRQGPAHLAIRRERRTRADVSRRLASSAAVTRPSARFISAIPTSRTASRFFIAGAGRFLSSRCRTRTATSRGGSPT